MVRKRRDAGFSLAVLIFFATAASILLTTAIPVYRMQAQREREEELIFRGEEYMRAIQKYQRRFGIYPPSVDALQQQNGLRFIRRLYTDPTNNKPFRLIYLNPDGSLTGSKVFSQNITNTTQANNLNAGGNLNSTPNPNPNSISNANPNLNPNPNPSAGGNRNANSNPSPSPNPNANPGPSPLSPSAPLRPNPTSGNTRNGQNQTFGTAGIIGVASDTAQTSIKVYNGRQKYDEWEFLAILGQSGATNNNPNPTQTPNPNPSPNSGPNPNPNSNPNPNNLNPNPPRR